MRRVTSVRPLGRKRCRVWLDEEQMLILRHEEISAFGIQEGSVLDEEQMHRLMESVLKPGARERVLKALLASDKTEEQLRKLLIREGYPEEAIQDALQMAKGYHYLDDRAYGLRYAEQESRKMSRRKLALSMTAKGFPHEVIREALEELPVDEDGQIDDLIRKKGIHPGQTMEQKHYIRLTSMLARKGYSWERISSAVNRWQIAVEILQPPVKGSVKTRSSLLDDEIS